LPAAVRVVALSMRMASLILAPEAGLALPMWRS